MEDKSVEMSIEEALGEVAKAVRSYKAFKRIEGALRAFETIKMESVAMEERLAKLTIQAAAQGKETAAVVSMAKAEQEAFRSSIAADKRERLESVTKESMELESKLAAKLTPLQAEEVRLEKSVENLSKESSMLEHKIQIGEKKLETIQKEIERVRAQFS